MFATITTRDERGGDMSECGMFSSVSRLKKQEEAVSMYKPRPLSLWVSHRAIGRGQGFPKTHGSTDLLHFSQSNLIKDLTAAYFVMESGRPQEHWAETRVKHPLL